MLLGDTCSTRTEPRCELQCVNGGTCIRDLLTTSPVVPLMTSAAHCACPPGWAGTICDLPINPPINVIVNIIK